MYEEKKFYFHVPKIGQIFQTGAVFLTELH